MRLQKLAIGAFALIIMISGSVGGGLAQSGDRDVNIDELFTLLAEAPNAGEAFAIADRIWTYWTQPEDPELASSMAEILEWRRSMRLNAAMNALTRLTREYPEYAEAWNQRATLHFMLGNTEESLSDIKEVLKREPRHFGALAGKAIILLQQGDDQGALEAMTRALQIHPYLPERGLFPQLVEPATRT